jgi:hypothetical protein
MVKVDVDSCCHCLLRSLLMRRAIIPILLRPESYPPAAGVLSKRFPAANPIRATVLPRAVALSI